MHCSLPLYFNGAQLTCAWMRRRRYSVARFSNSLKSRFAGSGYVQRTSASAKPRGQPSYRHVVFFAVQIPFILLVLPSFAWRTIFFLLVFGSMNLAMSHFLLLQSRDTVSFRFTSLRGAADVWSARLLTIWCFAISYATETSRPAQTAEFTLTRTVAPWWGRSDCRLPVQMDFLSRESAFLAGEAD